MDRYERAFHKLLRHMGKDVMVTKRMKQYDSNNKIIVDNKGQPKYTKTTNHCLAQIDLIKGTERYIEGLILQPGDAIGYFQKKDIQHLNTDTIINVEIDGLKFQFEVLEINPDLINIVVPMKRIKTGDN